MATKYNVWLSIEEANDNADHYEDVGLPDKLSSFDTFKEADEFVNSIHTKLGIERDLLPGAAE